MAAFGLRLAVRGVGFAWCVSAGAADNAIFVTRCGGVFQKLPYPCHVALPTQALGAIAAGLGAIPDHPAAGKNTGNGYDYG